jgi:phosphoglucosamine mutase
VDGDAIMAILANSYHEKGLLKGNAIAATVMSNLGLERYLKSKGIDLVRTAVGDRYVVEAMREKGINIGGEQSGHMILSDYATTGDGLLTAVQILTIMTETSQDILSLSRLFDQVPQHLENVRIDGLSARDVMESVDVQAAIQKAEQTLNGYGRVLVRPSGTEPLIRVMAEGDDESQVKGVITNIVETINKAG